MKNFLKNLKWLTEHKKEIEDMLKTNKTKKADKNYDLSGVPAYQLDYINDILEAEKK